jgi:hypothetical protein
MTQTEKTKRFILSYWNAVSGHPKTEELIRRYVDDERLVNHILFFESLFPEYELVPKEVIAENDKVFVQANLKAKHSGVIDSIPATGRKIEAPFAIGYQVRNNRIVNFWAIADQMDLLEQLGLAAEQVDVVPA